jgi:hypothetical protein
MLLQQIEERTRKKEMEKQQRLQEELEEEERVKKEIEAINAREMGENEDKKNKQQQFKQMLDDDVREKDSRQKGNSMKHREMRESERELPPEFQELADEVEEQQQKKVNFEQFPSGFPSIPEGKNMFSNEFKGTNTQRLNEIQLKFQNEVVGLKSEISNKHHEILSLVTQLKDAQESLKNKESSEMELKHLREELKRREQEERNQQAMLQNQLIELMKGYQNQMSYLTKMNDQPTQFQRPGSNRNIGGNRDTRSSELRNFEKMLFSGSNQPTSYNDLSNVMIDFNNPASKPYVKPSISSGEPSNQVLVDLSKSSSLNAKSYMVPINDEMSTPNKRPPRSQNYENTSDLGGTNGSTNRKLNKELDEIERMNFLNANEFPGSLQGTRNLDQIDEEEVESLRNTSKFEEVKDSHKQYIHNNIQKRQYNGEEKSNPSRSLENSSTYKLNQTSITDPKVQNGSMKIENFDGFPELPEYEGIQKEYMRSEKDFELKTDKALYEDSFEGTAGTAKSIDFDELQKKLTQTTDVSPYKPREPDKPERKKWSEVKPRSIQKEHKLDKLQKEMEGIDKLIDEFTPKENHDKNIKSDFPIYESEPDNFNKFASDSQEFRNERYKPNLESILEQSNEYTLSKGNELLSRSERKLIQEELRKNDN